MGLNEALAAVADPTRRAICQRLAHGRASTGQLAALFPISRPAVSQHLKVLKDAGLIRLAGEHRLSPYELVPGPVLEIEAWAARLARSWQAAPLPRDDHARRDDIRRDRDETRSDDIRSDDIRRAERPRRPTS